MNPSREMSEAQAEEARDYEAPAVASIITARNRWFYQMLEEWRTPDGWDGDFLMDLEIYPSLRPGLVLRELRGALVIHDPITMDMHSLNETAALLLCLSNGLRAVHEICSEYERKLSLSHADAVADVLRILGELFEKKVLLPRPKKTYEV